MKGCVKRSTTTLQYAKVSRPSHSILKKIINSFLKNTTFLFMSNFLEINFQNLIMVEMCVSQTLISI